MSEPKAPVSGQSTISTGGPRKKMGRPTIYSAELATTLCDYLARGESLRTACAHKGMPDVKTVFNWFSESNKELWRNDFLQQYTRAKQEAADMLAEQILDISNTPAKGKVTTTRTTTDKDGNAVTITEVREDDMLGHRRLQVDTRKFLMAKMKPKIYGDKFDVTSDGEKIEVGRGMTIEEINAILDRAEKERREVAKANTAPQTGPDEHI